MKVFVLAILFLPALAFARSHIEGWHDDEITACGNRLATQGELKALAEQKCGGEVSLVGDYEQAGRKGVKIGMFVRLKKEHCQIFKCSSPKHLQDSD